MAVEEWPKCADCGFDVKNMKPATIAKGSTVRDPGEAVCISCSAKRTRLVETLKKIPTDIRQIRAMRMVRA